MNSRLVLLALSALCLLHHPSADACPTSKPSGFDDGTRQLACAEALLDRGRYAQALRHARATEVSDRIYESNKKYLLSDAFTPERVQARIAAISRRKQRVIAIAQLRLGEVKAARAELALMLKDAPDDPELRARNAEAMIATGDMEGGRAILEDLVQRDLMPDAEGWLAVAKLRDGDGDVEARTRAVTRCKAMSKKQNKKNACAFAFKTKSKSAAKK